MKIKLFDYTQVPELKIGLMAAKCYDSKTDLESCIKRATHCKDSGHLATLRFAYATFEVSGISRVCSHQLVRIAHAGILQESQRYVAQSAIKYIDPPAVAALEEYQRQAWYKIQSDAEAIYLSLIATKSMKKEDARYILPQGCETSMNICMNFQGWVDFLKNRTSKHAQWEIRDAALEIQRQLAGIAPRIFGDAK